MLHFLLLPAFICLINVHLGSSSPTQINIVGGSPAKIEDHPHQVAILQNERLWCAGSIITEFFALTAAHCVAKALAPLWISSGSTSWINGTRHKVLFGVVYGPKRSLDIAVLRVRELFHFDATRQPIPIFNKDEEAIPGTMAVVSGWGLTDMSSGLPSDTLMSVEVPIVDRKICNDSYIHTLIGKIGNGQLCAGYYDEGKKDSCDGDSGSALVIQGKQAGVVSAGNGCGIPKFPGIYANVAYFHDWIMDQIRS